MTILEKLDIIKKEKALGRTPKGRALSDFAIKAIDATISDEKNYQMEAIQCLGCGFVVSSLLVSDGCPNCGAIDMTENIIDG